MPTRFGLRGNTDMENLHGFVAARYRGEGGAWLACSASSFLGERGIAAELGVPDEDARLWRYPHVSRTLAVVSAGSGLRKSPLGRSGAVEASIGIGRGRTDIDSYASRDYHVIAAFEDGREGTLTFRLAAEQSLGPRGDLRAGFTASDIHHDEVIPEGRFEYQQGLWSAGLESDWRLLESPGALKSLALSAGGALDVSRTPKSGGREALGRVEEWGGRVGLSAVVAGGGAILHASVGRRGRFPSLRELYSGALNRFAPNPDLEPEKLVAAEAGVTTALACGEAQAVVFHHRLDDAVVRTALEDGRFMRVNRDVLRSHGVELVGKYSIASVEMAANLTLQDVELTDTRAAETNRPENIPERFGGLSTRFPLPFGAEGGMGIEYTGEQFAIDPATGGDSRLPAQAIMDASVSRTWRGATPRGVGRLSTVEVRCAVDNVCDALLFGAAGLPEPGRRIRLEVRIH
jgi:iron complex outermembrane receptor protein